MIGIIFGQGPKAVRCINLDPRARAKLSGPGPWVQTQLIMRKYVSIFDFLAPIDASLREESVGERIFEIGKIFLEVRKILGLERDRRRYGRPDRTF